MVNGVQENKCSRLQLYELRQNWLLSLKRSSSPQLQTVKLLSTSSRNRKRLMGYSRIKPACSEHFFMHSVTYNKHDSHCISQCLLEYLFHIFIRLLPITPINLGIGRNFIFHPKRGSHVLIFL